MKSNDLYIFIAIIVFSIFLGNYIFDEEYKRYSDLINFLSIMIGFKIASLSILFNSPLKKTLYDRGNYLYKTELHRLKDFYKHALYYEVFSVCILFIDFPNKYLIIMPIISGTVYCFYKITSELLRIFTYPTND
ncbi:hypothetical protein CRV08_02295 [Halarcobacter ebronensis]|uniref:Uncharacterized protein n=1 Tax=Halarcobacter ebronensis TaxID=1462615 RepID=A0A4Q1AQF8_9BACT|nr:hypothetical protein [Halarcobacter ebronensis]QKF82937.1 putative membrane protein [Halarcobacter ebronensis]RXJ69555.1 hypothetical protein CRV08_02295 [Halarcobacter ebronensis]RXK06952.1 hypothetical protein CRV07_05860 [Halarcobacter ebronensis]